MCYHDSFVVDVAQLVELRIVAPAVVGSNPIVHPSSYPSRDSARKKMAMGGDAESALPPICRRWRNSQGFVGVFRTKPIESVLSDALGPLQEHSQVAAFLPI